MPSCTIRTRPSLAYMKKGIRESSKEFLELLLLHVKIAHFDSVASVIITSVASVAFFSQGRKCRMLLTSVASVREAYYHDAYVVPIMT
jgi:hypothetical protein